MPESKHQSNKIPLDFTLNAISVEVISSIDMAFLLKLYTLTRWQEVQQAPWDDQQRLDFLKQQFDAQHTHYQSHYPHADYLLIQKSQKNIGRLYIDRDETSICLIDIALLNEYKYRGIGSKILNDLINEADKTKKKIVIHVENFNPAYQWYLDLGFKHIEDKGVYQYMEYHPK